MLIDAMKRQFGNTFDVLEAAIKSFTPDQWIRGSAPFNGPGRAAAHALLCAEGYTRDDKSIREKFGMPVWQMSDADLPTQRQVVEYAAEARSKTMAWIDAMGDGGLSASCAEDKSTLGLERVVYALRHLQHHTGEICAYQKQCGLDPAPWR